MFLLYQIKNQAGIQLRQSMGTRDRTIPISWDRTTPPSPAGYEGRQSRSSNFQPTSPNNTIPTLNPNNNLLTISAYLFMLQYLLDNSSYATISRTMQYLQYNVYSSIYMLQHLCYNIHATVPTLQYLHYLCYNIYSACANATISLLQYKCTTYYSTNTCLFYSTIVCPTIYIKNMYLSCKTAYSGIYSVETLPKSQPKDSTILSLDNLKFLGHPLVIYNEYVHPAV